MSQKETRLDIVRAQYALYKERPLDLTIARGIPSKKQLKLSEGLVNDVKIDDWVSEDDIDIRNYGGLYGIKEARALFGSLLNTTVEETFVGGNSSLQLMFAVLSHHLFTKDKAWNKSKDQPVKFLCPSPGYDRHWFMLEHLGIEMIPVELTGNGPDMEVVEKLVSQDPSIKGMFVVPKYNNPTGESVSDDVVDRLAAMHTAADDFLILWDNAYVVHHLRDEKVEVKDIFKASKAAGNPDRVIQFVSTSKMTLPGAGVAAMGASVDNLKEMADHFGKQLISFDKINQKRHVAFLKDRETIEAHMEKHAEILAPKFDWIEAILSAYFHGDRESFVSWTSPQGGYFVHLTTDEGCASKVVEKMTDIGISLTPANAAYPYGINPLDNSIRLAPSFATLDHLEIAMEALCVCIEMVTLEKYESL
ncbi:DNA-binding transcriptional regulator, MocR family, contains an aminotransferase domain [Alkalibacterium subtropicum]|uniref:DNA-binding transcriptional regulator, MocR family, contains an aminotransferase domain n=1 Tax=Alkalibacterium subtropicum TaxID=753702 RepID=A0A1I1J5R6_9LACT|nr:aminotransferase class I/II-fold pyridoxal phosphate-dependent enzyme [Alkalibacterium subtropicum]SFC41948.1 DNA-binding transcriptional regulator, MocR family, contains an aminotransferase domain [Alkalibacterium subtropicum]